MNDSDVLVAKQLLGHCDAIQKRIAEFEIDVDKFTGNSAFFDMLLMPLVCAHKRRKCEKCRLRKIDLATSDCI